MIPKSRTLWPWLAVTALALVGAGCATGEAPPPPPPPDWPAVGGASSPAKTGPVITPPASRPVPPPATRPTTQAATQPIDDQTRAAAADLIRQLGDDAFQVREAATQRLIALGPRVAPLVEAAVQATTDSEVRIRGREVLRVLRKPQTPSLTATDPDTGITVTATKAMAGVEVTRLKATRGGKTIWEGSVIGSPREVEIDGGLVIVTGSIGCVVELESGKVIRIGPVRPND